MLFITLNSDGTGKNAYYPNFDNHGVDDHGNNATRDTETIATTAVHHLELIFFMVFHQLYASNPVHRSISNNATYLHLTSNKRDRAFLAVLARQLFGPSFSRVIVKIFIYATERMGEYGYLFFDLHQSTESMFKMRTNVFGERGGPPIVFVIDDVDV